MSRYSGVFGFGGSATGLGLRDASIARPQRGWRYASSLLAGLFCLSLAMPGLAARDGSRDPAFGNNGVLIHDLPVTPMISKVQADGRLVVGGRMQANPSAAVLLRFLPNGELDPEFGDGGLAELPRLESLNLRSDETLDFSQLVLLPDGRMVAAGAISFWGPERRCPLVAMFEEDGSLVTSFGDGGAVCVGTTIAVGPTFLSSRRSPALAVTASGILVSELFTFVSDSLTLERSTRLYRLLDDGTLDPTFGVNGMLEFDAKSEMHLLSVAEDSAGRILAGNGYQVARLSKDGVLDTSYGDGGFSRILPWQEGWWTWDSFVGGMSIQPNGKSTLFGAIYRWPTFERRAYAFARRLADGSPDPQLAPRQRSIAPGLVAAEGSTDAKTWRALGPLGVAALQQPDGKTVFLGRELLRLNADGSHDCGFGQGGYADVDTTNDFLYQTLAFGPDDRLWVARRSVPQGGGIGPLELRKYIAEAVFGDGFQTVDCEAPFPDGAAR